jgi:hypothetical protein
MTTETVENSDEALIKHIAETLKESNTALIKKVVYVISAARAQEFLQKTLEIEAQGGLLTDDQKRCRTPGGVFFKLVKDQTTPTERQAIFPHIARRQQQKKQADEQSHPLANAGQPVGKR